MRCDSEAGSGKSAKTGDRNPLAGSGGARCLVARLLVRLIVATARGNVSAVFEEICFVGWKILPSAVVVGDLRRHVC